MPRTIQAAAIAAVVLLAGCTSQIQTTSGKAYLAGYDRTTTPTGGEYAVRIDDEVRAIAAIEPNLRFPARIGLARIERGQLTSIPINEGQVWAEVITDLGEQYGELVPVNPLIAATVAPPPDVWENSAQEVIGHIRRGAARQHLDYVLVYEVTQVRSRKTNALAITDLTLLGLSVFPSRDLRVRAVASGLMIDVRNGYPYMTSTTFADEQGLSVASNVRTRFTDLGDDATSEAVAALAVEFETGLSALRDVAQAEQSASVLSDR